MRLTISFSLALLCTFCGLAQTDSIVSFNEVVAAPGASKSQLFSNARSWFNQTFKSSKDVLQIIDKESGELSGKGIFYTRMRFKYAGGTQKKDAKVNMTVSIWVKEGRYKYEFTDFVVNPWEKDEWDFVLTSSPTCPVKWPMVRQSVMDAMYANAKESVERDIRTLFITLLKQKMKDEASSDF